MESKAGGTWHPLPSQWRSAFRFAANRTAHGSKRPAPANRNARSEPRA